MEWSWNVPLVRIVPYNVWLARHVIRKCPEQLVQPHRCVHDAHGRAKMASNKGALAVGHVEGHVAEGQQLEQQHDEEQRRQPLERVLRGLAQVEERQACAHPGANNHAAVLDG